MEENGEGLTADIPGNEISSGAKCPYVALGRGDKKNKVQEYLYKMLEKPKLVRLERKERKKELSYYTFTMVDVVPMLYLHLGI